MEAELTLQRLYSVLRYDPDTGVFTNRGCHEWRGRRAEEGTLAGFLHNTGRWAIKIDGRRYMAHRLAWFYVYQEWPKGSIDHIDGNPLNNRIDNLRDVSHSQNLRNRIGRGTYRSGSRWAAKITLAPGGEKTTLGHFDTEEEAHQAYLSAKLKYHPECERRYG